LVERVRRVGLVAGLQVVGEPRDLPASVDLAGYRIVQEALTNALKHGDSPVDVTLSYEAGRVVVQVENAVAGRGSRLPGAGAGLIGMRERASLVGGSCEAGPPGDGRGWWRVVAALPTSDDLDGYRITSTKASPKADEGQVPASPGAARRRGERSVVDVRPEGA
jgi:signal transduction histidine kinase